MKSYLLLQNAKVYSFYHFKLSREEQQRGQKRKSITYLLPRLRLNKVIHKIAGEWTVASFVSFNNFFNKMWFDFWPNTEKHLFVEVSL